MTKGHEMENDIREPLFASSMDTFAAILPKRIDVPEDEICSVEIPGWRYDEIREAVLKMYQDVDARIMPLPVFDIAIKLGCALIPYRAFGKSVHDALMSASPDAVLLLRGFSPKQAVICYNDRKPINRIHYSLMHEVGHLCLNHGEHCPLAEKEANHFAAVALCPIVLLEEYGITNALQVERLFEVSAEFANNRIAALNRRHGRIRCENERDRAFRKAVLKRFHFRDGIQMELFSNLGCPMRAIA